MIGWLIYLVGCILSLIVVMYYVIKDLNGKELELTLVDILGLLFLSVFSWVVVISVPIGMEWDKITKFFNKPIITINSKKDGEAKTEKAQ